MQNLLTSVIRSDSNSIIIISYDENLFDVLHELTSLIHKSEYVLSINIDSTSFYTDIMNMLLLVTVTNDGIEFKFDGIESIYRLKL